MFNWHNVTPSNSPKFMVKGTELNTAIVPETMSRFQICEIRSLDEKRMPDRIYYIRDANTISDAEVKEGIRPRVVARFNFEDDAIEFALESFKNNLDLKPI